MNMFREKINLPTSQLRVKDLVVTVVRKRVKNINLGIYPPNGEVRVSAPLRCSDDVIVVAVTSRLSWIKSKQAALLKRPLSVAKQMVSGESHYVMGQLHELLLIEQPGSPKLMSTSEATLLLYVRPGTDREKRKRILDDWYRDQLRIHVPPLLAQWQDVIGVQVNEWRIRKMKTRWGSCNIRDKRIWLNLQLAKTPPASLEYVLVHELIHLLERYHNRRFWSLVERYIPDWRERREELKGFSDE